VASSFPAAYLTPYCESHVPPRRRPVDDLPRPHLNFPKDHYKHATLPPLPYPRKTLASPLDGILVRIRSPPPWTTVPICWEVFPFRPQSPPPLPPPPPFGQWATFLGRHSSFLQTRVFWPVPFRPWCDPHGGLPLPYQHPGLSTNGLAGCASPPLSRLRKDFLFFFLAAREPGGPPCLCLGLVFLSSIHLVARCQDRGPRPLPLGAQSAPGPATLSGLTSMVWALLLQGDPSLTPPSSHGFFFYFSLLVAHDSAHFFGNLLGDRYLSGV